MKTYVLSLVLSFISIFAYSQQATEIDTKSLKLPRYANLSVINSAIPSPQQGMMVYNIGTATNWYYDGSAWVELSGNKVDSTTVSEFWGRLNDFTGASRRNFTTFVINGKGYICCGRFATSPFNYTKELWEYDPTSDKWTRKADFPGVRREYASAFVINGKAYVGIGYGDTGALQDFYEYDPTTNTWAAKANFGGGQRQQASSFNIGSLGYISGGKDASFLYQFDTWEYNPTTNIWTAKANLPTTTSFTTIGFAFGGFGFVGIYNSTTDITNFYKYNPASNSWAFATAYPQAGYPFFSAVTPTKVYLGLGYEASNPAIYWHEYNTVSNTWTAKKSFIGERSNGQGGFSIGEKVYYGLTELNSFWEYDPQKTNIYLSNSGTSTINYEYNDAIWKQFPTKNINNTNLGNLGIFNNNPLTKVHIDLSQRTEDVFMITGNPSYSTFSPYLPEFGEGRRFIYYPSAGALRVGFISGTNWSSTNIGQYSVAFNANTTARGINSAAFGSQTSAQAHSSFAIGANNDPISTSSSTFWNSTDPLVYVGNGTSGSNRSNALVIYKNANTDISGYTRLGTVTEDAPRIKMKKISTTSPAVSSLKSVAHGLTDSKILGVQVLLDYGSGRIPPSYIDVAGYEYNIQVQFGNIVLINKNGNSNNIGGKPVTILITYEE